MLLLTISAGLFGLVCFGALCAVALGANKISAENDQLRGEVQQWKQAYKYLRAHPMVVPCPSVMVDQATVADVVEASMPAGWFGQHES